LPGLIVGSFIPDIEVLFLRIFFPDIPDHLVLRSLIGAATIGMIISVFATVFLYPILASIIFRIDRIKLKEACKLTPALVLSCMLGNLFHIILDIPMHPFNPVFWPFIDPYDFIGILVLLFAFNGDLNLGFIYASILTHVVMGILSFIILIKSRKDWRTLVFVDKNSLIKSDRIKKNR